jgi:hypothetical protein
VQSTATIANAAQPVDRGRTQSRVVLRDTFALPVAAAGAGCVLSFVPAFEEGASKGAAEEVEHQPGRRCSRVNLDPFGVEGENREDLAVPPVARWRPGAAVARHPGVVWELKSAGWERCAGLVASAGRQLGDVGGNVHHGPVPEAGDRGRFGSHIVTTKLFVPEGKPLQERCGEVSSPPAPKMPLTCGIASFSPSRRSSLVSENDAAAGRLSYGSQLMRFPVPELTEMTRSFTL